MLRLGAILHRIKKTQFSHANLLGASRLSTTTTRDQTTSAFWGSTEKISPVGLSEARQSGCLRSSMKWLKWEKT